MLHETLKQKYHDPVTGCHFEYFDLCKRLSQLKQRRKLLDKKLGVKTSSEETTPRKSEQNHAVMKAIKVKLNDRELKKQIALSGEKKAGHPPELFLEQNFNDNDPTRDIIEDQDFSESDLQQSQFIQTHLLFNPAPQSRNRTESTQPKNSVESINGFTIGSNSRDPEQNYLEKKIQ